MQSPLVALLSSTQCLKACMNILNFKGSPSNMVEVDLTFVVVVAVQIFDFASLKSEVCCYQLYVQHFHPLSHFFPLLTQIHVLFSVNSLNPALDLTFVCFSSCFSK